MSQRRAPTFHVEVNAAAYFLEDGKVLNDDMVDLTLAFGARVTPPAGTMTDARIQEGLAQGVAQVMAVIRVALTGAGFAYTGEVQEGDEATRHSRQVGTGHTPPVRVILAMGEQKEHRA